MKLRRTSAVTLALALWAVAPARAWTPPTRVRMVDEAIRLMPASLRLALERYREWTVRGALEAMSDEDGAAHRPPWDGGSLDAEVASRAADLLRAIDEEAPFGEIARRFGELAHFVADTGFPPGAAGAAGASRYSHFGGFCESRREKFPLVFYGHREPNLARGDFRAFARAALDRARGEDAELARAYAAAGNPPAAAAFDDRSVPFAVGSLSYSRTVTDIARAWLAAWATAQGDVGRTPYLVKTPKGED